MGWKCPDTVEPCYCVIRSAWEALVGCPNDPKGQGRPAGNEEGGKREGGEGMEEAGREGTEQAG